MVELRGYDSVVDQVLRRREFEQAHAVKISHTEDPWMWHAVWFDHGCRCMAHDEELSGLLDRLDAILG